MQNCLRFMRGAKLCVWLLHDTGKLEKLAKQNACQNVNKAISVPLLFVS